MSLKWLEWAKRIQSLSQSGLTFSKDVFDLERFEELRQISVEIMEEHTGVEMQKIKDLFAAEKGYQTPKMDVRGAVFHQGKILMVRENIDNKWSLPGVFVTSACRLLKILPKKSKRNRASLWFRQKCWPYWI